MESRADALAYLQALHDATLVIWDGHRVLLRPTDVARQVYTKLGIRGRAGIFDDNDDIIDLNQNSTDINAAQNAAAVAVDRTAMFRRRFWSTVAVGSGLQMTALAYLTFVAYDWDVMEPACYFVTCATSIAFYVYFLVCRREQSLVQVDENVLPKKLQKELVAASSSSLKSSTNVGRVVDAAWLQAALEAHDVVTKDHRNRHMSTNSYAAAGVSKEEWFAALR